MYKVPICILHIMAQLNNNCLIIGKLVEQKTLTFKII